MNKTDEKGLSSQMKSGLDATSIAQLGTPLSKLAAELRDSSVAPIIDTYSSGKNFTIGSNDKLYEIVKLVKNVIDVQFYNRGNTSYSFNFSIDVRNHSVVFGLTFDNAQAPYDADNKICRPDGYQGTMDFAEKLADTIEFSVKRAFADSVDIERKIEQIMGADSFMGETAKTQMSIIVRERTEKE